MAMLIFHDNQNQKYFINQGWGVAGIVENQIKLTIQSSTHAELQGCKYMTIIDYIFSLK